MPDTEPWSLAAFEARYAATIDPWSFTSSTYEFDRYATILDALRPEPHRYRLGYEPACAEGVLTELLAARCDALVATDVSPTAVARANDRCGGRAGVRIEAGSVADGPPSGEAPDLIVFSELGYYFDERELEAIVTMLAGRVERGADLVACHWTGVSPDHRLAGATVHRALRRTLASHAQPVRGEVHDGFLIDSWRFP